MTTSQLSHETPPFSRLQRAGLFLALMMITFAAYLPAIGNGFIWDDDVHVTKNAALIDSDGLVRLWFKIGTVPQYYPLVHTTFWIERHLWDLDARGYHAVNIILHGLAAGLLWIALRRLKLPAAVAWLAAAVFALHPVHVESVAWVTERKNVLSLVFYLAAFLAYFKFDEAAFSDSPAHASAMDEVRPLRWQFYVLALALFACALLSKTVTCSLPAAILLVIWWKRGRLTWRDVGPTLPLFAMGLASGLMTAWMEKGIVGASGSEWGYGFAERLQIAGNAVWFYAMKLLWPANLTFIYPRWKIGSTNWILYVGPIAAALLLVALWMSRHRIGRGPVAAALFFGGTLTPALGFFDVYPFRFSFVADHFQYHASIGLIVLVTAGLIAVVRRLGRNALVCNVALWPAMLAILAALTARQTGIYFNAETLWADTLAKNPNSFIANGNYGDVLYAQGKWDEAVAYWRKALQEKPDLVEAYNSLGGEHARRGEWDQAIAHFRKAIELEPKFAPAHLGLGTVFAKQGKWEDAIGQLQAAVELAPDMVDARMNLGLALFRAGRFDDAGEQLAQAAYRAPNGFMPHFLFANFLADQNHDDLAIEQFQIALRLQPNQVDSRIGLAKSLIKLGRTREAAAELERALAILPNHPQARKMLDDIAAHAQP